MDEEFPVKVYVYDLARGLAPVLAPQLLGIHLPAVYHTSVVVYGKEYYIDQGIKTSAPGKTKYGLPIEVLDVGATYITQDIFEDYIEELRVRDDMKFTAVRYDLFDNNCNHFTDTVLQFAVDRRLESRILSLPETVLNTEGGRMLRAALGSQLW